MGGDRESLGREHRLKPMESRTEFVVDGDVRIEVRIDGRGPALVLLPSSQRDSLDLDEFAVDLAARGFRVLRPQPRGMAGSTGPLEGLTLHHLARDVAGVIAQFGDGRAIVAGHAFGHFIARVTALDHSQHVCGVVAMGAAARTFPPGLSAQLDIAADPAQPQELRLAALRQAFFASGSDPRPWLEGWHPDLRTAYRRAAFTPPKDTWWPTSAVPVLEIQGTEDPWRPPDTRLELKHALGELVTVRLIAHASHALLPEQPAAVADAIADWAIKLPR